MTNSGPYRPSHATNWRPVLRLAMMLAVTLMLINQARRPELYERFFAAAGAPLNAPTTQLAVDPPPSNLQTAPQTAPSSAPPVSPLPTDRSPSTGQLSHSPGQAVWHERWQMMSQSLSPRKRHRLLPPLAALWFGLPLGESEASPQAIIRTTAEVSQWLEEIAAEESPPSASPLPKEQPPGAVWRQMATRLNTTDWETVAAGPGEPTGWQPRVPLQTTDWPESFRLATDRFLDEQLAEIAHTPSPWLPSQRLSYLRGIQKIQHSRSAASEALSPESASTWSIEPSQLLVHFSQLAGHPVRLRGRIGAITEAPPNPLTPTGYPIVWIARPGEDPQPAAVHLIPPRRASPDQPSPNQPSPDQLSSAATEEQPAPAQPQLGETIEIVGLPLKPLSYRSQRGPNLAAVVLASHWRTVAAASEISPQTVETTFAMPRADDSSRIDLLPADAPSAPPPPIELIERLLSDPLQSALTATAELIAPGDAQAARSPGTLPPLEPSLLRAMSQLERLTQLGASSSPYQWPHAPLGDDWQLQSWEGWAVAIEPLPVPREARSWWPTRQLYLLTLAGQPTHRPSDLARSPQTTPTGRALVSHVPKEWLSGELCQPVVLWGAVPRQPTPAQSRWLDGIESSPPSQSPPPAVMLVGQLQWRLASRSDNQAPAAHDHPWTPTLPGSWLWLLERDFDLMLVNTLRRAGHAQLSADEAEPFYRLLQLASWAGDELTAADSGDPLPLSDILASPDQQVLMPTRFTLRALRCREVPITDPALQEQLGGDRYFEIQGLANLGDLRIEYQPPDGEDRIVFDGQFPVTVVSQQLPSWMIDSQPSSATLPSTGVGTQDLDVSGVFYRLWSYRRAVEREPVSDGGTGTILQISPLVVATQLLPLEAGWQDSSDPQQRLQWIPLSLLIVVAIGLAIAAWTSRWKASPLKSR